jgi:hypothetical protein
MALVNVLRLSPWEVQLRRAVAEHDLALRAIIRDDIPLYREMLEERSNELADRLDALLADGIAAGDIDAAIDRYRGDNAIAPRGAIDSAGWREWLAAYRAREQAAGEG